MRASEYCSGNYADQHPFAGEGQFYKGNLHTHTTLTDGCMDPKPTLEKYRAGGYDFISITDHFIYTNTDEWNVDGLLLFPGVEVNYDDKEHYLFDHLVGVLLDPEGGYEHGKELKPFPPSVGWSVQRMIDELKRTGHFVIYAHPNWSHRDASTLCQYENVDAMEIYNTCCDLRFACGYSDHIYDTLLQRGKKWNIVATDDTHTPECFCGGWICVKAKEKTHAAIAEALRAGRYYASNGPEIYDYKIENGIVSVDCSPADKVYFVTYDHWGKTVVGEGMTHAEFKLRGDESFLRIAVKDAKGNFAYTQPMYFY
ncbi:MAG: CehA/McbA family metallohydrolase [Clostridia bacterium]|nr:CehA/McbA family metallohydrolase [Clostridia bacterium]